jgi:3-dehydroquinate dehydratase II
MSRIVFVLNGPNLNLLGERQPQYYGTDTLADVERQCQKLGDVLGLEIVFHQSNTEGEIIDYVHKARTMAGGIVINPAAFTSVSIALLDALNTFDGPVVEVHISNIHHREKFRHYSFISERADGIIVGCGTQGYALAIRRIGHVLQPRH